jgi:hypothetical protein
MDVRFLKTIAEAYIVKYGLHESLTVDKIYEDVYDLIKELRETDIELYDHLYDSPRLQQQAILMSYFQLEYGSDEEIDESITIPTASIITGIFLYLYGGKLTKGILYFANQFGKLVTYVGKGLTRHGRYWKFRYAIIQQNARKCYTECGVSEKDISVFHYLSTGSKEPMISSPKASKQAQCLSGCYIKYTIEVLSLLTKSYFVCLKKTGDFDQVQNIGPDDILKVLSGLKLSNTCLDYYNEMKDLFSEFNHLLDYVHGKNETKKTEAMRMLKEKLIAARNEVKNVRNLQRYK